MRYRIYKGEEYYGRNINYVGTFVLYCEGYGIVGTRGTEEEIESLKDSFEYNLMEDKYMKVLMIGTPTCSKCKSIRPKIEEYCREHAILFTYEHFSTLHPDIVSLIRSKGISSAPLFLVYRTGDEDPRIVSGDDIYIELD